MPGRLRAIIDFLKGLFPRKKMHIDETDEAMHIRNKEDDYQIDEVVVAMVGFDPDTGRFFRLGTWEGAQIFNNTVNINDLLTTQDIVPDVDCTRLIGSATRGFAELHLCLNFLLTEYGTPLGTVLGLRNSLNTGYCGLDVAQLRSYGERAIMRSDVGVADAMRIGRDGNICAQMPVLNSTQRNALTMPTVPEGCMLYNATNAALEYYIAAWKTIANLEDVQTFTGLKTFDAGIHMPLGDPITFGDGDSYIEESVDDNIRIYVVDGTHKVQFGRYAMFMNVPIDFQGNNQDNVGFTKYDEISTPTATAGHVKLYAKEKGATNGLYFRRDDGTEEEIAVV